MESYWKDYGQFPHINGRANGNISIFRNDHGLVIGGPKDCGKTTGILMLTWLASEINATVRYWIYFSSFAIQYRIENSDWPIAFYYLNAIGKCYMDPASGMYPRHALLFLSRSVGKVLL